MKQRLRRRSASSVAILATMLAAGTASLPAQSASQSEFDNNGEDITRPDSRFEVRFERRNSGVTTKTERTYLYLRPSGVFDLESPWAVSWFAQLPILWKTTNMAGSPDSSEASGIGDIQLQAALIRPIDERWAYGFGANLVAPSAEDSLGSGKWQIRPILGFRYSFLEFGSNTYFVPKLRYAVSVGGDPSRRNINEPQIAPTFNIGLPDRWFVTLYPSQDIRINFGDPISGQKGRLFLPFDAQIGRKISDALTISFELGVPIVKDYPVYNLKARMKIAGKF
jgi:hypothetical protein